MIQFCTHHLKQGFGRLSVIAASILLSSLPNVLHASNQPAGDISLNLKAQPLQVALQEIEQQSVYTFVYNSSAVNSRTPITVQFSNKSIDYALTQVFNGMELHYEIIGRQIVLRPILNNSESSPQPLVEIKGKVVDNSGTGLPGVNVTIKGTTSGTITDLDGNFTIQAAPGNVLVISFVGYETEEIYIEKATQLDIMLEESFQKLDEIIVIGYGQESRRLLITSISDVQSEEIEKNAGNGALEAIQGKAAGIRIVQNSGTPGSALTVNIRGMNSLSSNNQPLYVVDGVPILSGDFGQINFEGQNIDALADLNPNNIESISVLKDASSAAIYGARGANGVVLIKTKSGSKGKSVITLNTYYGIQEAPKQLEMLNAQEWRNFVRSFDPGFVNGLADTTIDTDWQDEVLRRAPMSNLDLSIAGGDEKTRFYVSGRYFNQEGIVLGSAYEKFGSQVNLDHSLSKKIVIGLNLSTNYSINDRVVGDQTINGVLPNAISKPPIYAVTDSLGNYLEEGFWDNPVAIGNEVINQAIAFRNISNFFFDWKIIEGLSFKQQWGIDVYNLNERRYEPTTVRRGAKSNGIGINATSEILQITQQSTLNYSRQLGTQNKIDALFGYSYETTKERNSFIRKTNFPSDELEYVGSASVVEEATAGVLGEELQSVFGRLKYTYSSKYLAEFSARYDGSSNFGEENKYGFFPSLSLGWRISEEAFMDALEPISELKLKMGAGQIGNDQIGPFGYLNLYSSGRNYLGNPGLVPAQIPNPALKWETSTTYNGGIDLGLFNERIYATIDLFYKLTTDMLWNRPLPPSAGFSSVKSNIGEMQNKGFDVQLTTKNISGAFDWSTTLNYSQYRNKVLELYNGQPLLDQGRGGNAVIEEQPAGVFFMYKSLGVNPSTGDLVFVDLNENGEVDDADRMVVGDPNPDFIAGITNDFTYKGFDLSIFLQIVYGNDIFNGTRQYAEAMKFGTSDNQLVTVKDRWQKPFDQTYVPRLDGTYNNYISSHYIEDGSFLRIKDITLGYTIPQQILKKTTLINSMRVYVKGQNLYVLTPYSGMDPEVNYSGGADLRMGTDFFTYPNPRSFLFGLKLTF